MKTLYEQFDSISSSLQVTKLGKMMGRRCAYVGVVVLCLAVPILATVYTVGDSAGWTLGVDYGTWSTSKTLLVGDTLAFNYGSGHTVDEVSESDYSTCTVGNPINTDNKGSTTLLLQTPGNHYYICGVIGHCGSGMKLSVNVLASGASAANSTSTATSPPSTTPTTAASGAGYGTLPTTTTTMIPDSASSPPPSLSLLHAGLLIFGLSLVALSILL